MGTPIPVGQTAGGLEGHPDLVVVVKHTGWLRNGGADEQQLWRHGIDASLASGRTLCKLRPGHAPALDGGRRAGAVGGKHAIEAFGVAPLPVRQQPSGRRLPARQLLTSCTAYAENITAGLTTTSATSSSPLTPSASTDSSREN